MVHITTSVVQITVRYDEMTDPVSVMCVLTLKLSLICIEKRHQGLHKKSTKVKGQKSSDKSEEFKVHLPSEGSVADQGNQEKEHTQMSLQENPDSKQRDVQALLPDNEQLYSQPSTLRSLNSTNQCPDVQTHQNKTTSERKENNHQKLPETSNSVDKGAEVTTTGELQIPLYIGLFLVHTSTALLVSSCLISSLQN